MLDGALTAKKYREHAKQLRLVAVDTAEPDNATLQTIATSYEHLAKTIETLVGSGSPTTPSH